MRADSVTRVDERYLGLVNLVVSIYNGSGEPETTISMDEAAYDMTLGELRSKTPSKIDQPCFTMTGDTMIFESKSQVSRIEGNVKVIIPDVDELGPGFGFPTGP